MRSNITLIEYKVRSKEINYTIRTIITKSIVNGINVVTFMLYYDYYY